MDGTASADVSEPTHNAADGDEISHIRHESLSPPLSPAPRDGHLNDSIGAITDNGATGNGDGGADASDLQASRKSTTSAVATGEREREKERDRDRDSRDRRDYRRERSDDGSVNPGNNLYVTSLSTRTTEEELKAEFAKFGEIVDLQIVCDPHSRVSRGFAFVTMREVGAAEKAIESLKGMMLNGRAMMIEKARRGRPRTPTPGRYIGEDTSDRPAPRDRADRPRDRDRRETHYAPSYNDNQRYTPSYGDRPSARDARDTRDTRDSRDDYRGYARDDSRYSRDYDRRGGFDSRGAYPYDSYDRGYDRAYDRAYDRYDRPAAAYDRRSPGYLAPPAGAFDPTAADAYSRMYSATRAPGAGYDRYGDAPRGAYDRDSRYPAPVDPRMYDARAAYGAYPPAYDRYDRR
eukprot:Opistho-2@17581